MARAISVKSSSERKEASLELSGISLAEDPPSLQFHQSF